MLFQSIHICSFRAFILLSCKDFRIILFIDRVSVDHLWVYTSTGRAPFTVQNVTFRDIGRPPDPQHCLPTGALSGSRRLHTPSQPQRLKGTKGQALHHNCTGSPYSPVKSLARRVHHIIQTSNNDQSVGIYSYSDTMCLSSLARSGSKPDEQHRIGLGILGSRMTRAPERKTNSHLSYTHPYTVKTGRP